MNKRFLFIGFLIFFVSLNLAQSYRDLVNDGVDSYKEKKYSDSEINFRKGIEKNQKGFEAKFNLGDALYKQQRFDESAKYFNDAYTISKNDEQKAKALYNLGNALLKNQKINESINAYKSSLKINPYDKEAKFNLSYALNLLKNQNQQKNNQNNNNQNKDNKQNQNQNNEKQNDKKQNQKQNQQQEEQNKQNQKLKKDEAQRILDALKRNQKDIQKEMRNKKAKKVYVEKDW